MGPAAHPSQRDPLSTPRSRDTVTGDRNLLTRSDTATLVDAARDGNRPAFDELVRRTHRQTYTLALRLVGDAEDARDVTQEAYLRAYRALGKFRGDASFTTWLYRITANRAATHLKRRRRHRHDHLNEDTTRLEPVPAFADQVDTRFELERALRALPPKLRAAVVLHDVYGLTHAEISAELSISESAAKVRVHRARRRLRSDLFPGGVEPGPAKDDTGGSAHAM